MIEDTEFGFKPVKKSEEADEFGFKPVKSAEKEKSFTDTFQEHLKTLLTTNPTQHLKEEFNTFDQGMRNVGQGFGHALQSDIKNAVSSIPEPLMKALSPQMDMIQRAQQGQGNFEAPQPGATGTAGEILGHTAGFGLGGKGTFGASGLAKELLNSASKKISSGLGGGGWAQLAGLGPKALGSVLGAATYGASTANPNEGLSGGIEGAIGAAVPGALHATRRMIGANKFFQNKTNEILSTLKGKDAEEDLSRIAVSEMGKNGKTAKFNNKLLYDDFSEDANRLGAEIKHLPNTQEVAKEYLHNRGSETLSKEIKEMLEKHLTGIPSEIRNGIATKEGMPYPAISFEKAYERMKDFGRKSRAKEKTDPELSGMYKQLHRAMDQDMQLAAERSGYPELHEKLLRARKDYRENVRPYKENAIRNILNGKKDLDKISQTLFKDVPEYNKVLNDLPPDIAKKLVHMHFAKAIQHNPGTGKYESSPEKLFPQYNKLTQGQKNRLFSPVEQEKMDYLGVLSKHSEPTLGNIFHGIGKIPFSMRINIIHGLTTDPEFREAFLKANPMAKTAMANDLKKALSNLTVGTALEAR